MRFTTTWIYFYQPDSASIFGSATYYSKALVYIIQASNRIRSYKITLKRDGSNIKYKTSDEKNFCTKNIYFWVLWYLM